MESAEGAGATAPALAELRAWLAQEGNAKALLQHLVLDHTQLDAQEDAKVRNRAGLPAQQCVVPICALPCLTCLRGPASLNLCVQGKRGNIMAFLRGQAGRPFEESVMQTVMMAVDRWVCSALSLCSYLSDVWYNGGGHDVRAVYGGLKAGVREGVREDVLLVGSNEQKWRSRWRQRTDLTDHGCLSPNHTHLRPAKLK